MLVGCADPWVPTGGWQEVAHPECAPRVLEDLLLSNRGQMAAQQHAAEGFLSKCGDWLSRHSRSRIEELLADQKVIYRYKERPDFEPQTFINLEGQTVRAELFLKPGRRPLVIAKCGLQCDSGDSSLRHLLMHFFDESPFHVLLVPSISGERYERDNSVFAIGGFDEGRQLVELAQLVQSKGFRYADRISQVHVVGVSLGGQAALFAALYGGYVQRDDGRPVISTVWAGCPVVDLKKSVHALYEPTLLGNFFIQAFWQQVRRVSSYIPVIRDVVGELPKNPGAALIPDTIAKAALGYYKNATAEPGWTRAPLQQAVIRDRNDFWFYNGFERFVNKLRTPTFVWAADNDLVVRTRLNAGDLKQYEAENPNLHVMITPKGNHCDFTDAYGWNTTSILMRDLLIANSPDLVAAYRSTPYPLQYKSLPQAAQIEGSRRRRIAMRWSYVVDPQPELRLLHYVERPCLNPLSFNKCYSTVLSTVEPASIGLDTLPRTSTEAQALTRYLNTNAWLYGEAPAQNSATTGVHWVDRVDYSL